MINPAMIFKIKSSWERFTVSAANDVMREGTILEINITTPEGRELSTNLKLTTDDLQLIDDIKNMTR